MELIRKIISLIFGGLGEDAKWRAVIDHIGTGSMYVVLFAIIFAETGLVILPFLPGDSLLFAIGAMGARDIGINLPVLTVLLIIAAVIGDAVNYSIGKRVGPKVFSRDVPTSSNATGIDPLNYEAIKPTLSQRLLNKDHLLKAQTFYEKYGGKTIILARFVPIIRTFAPFVAGIGKMSYPRFAAYNLVGAVAWVVICIGAGRLFGGIPFVKKNFELVIIAIIVISVLPVVIEFWRARNASRRGVDPLVEVTTLEKVD